MSIFGLPLNNFQVQEVSDDMGDLEFIEGKVLASNYFQVSGDIDALNDTIEFIVPNLKTAFLIEAKIVITGHTAPAIFPGTGPSNTVTRDAVEADLKIDTVVKDTTNIGVLAQSSFRSSGTGAIGGYGNIGDGKFNVLGLSLVGDGAKVIEIENTLDDGSAFATMSGYLIDT